MSDTVKAYIDSASEQEAWLVNWFGNLGNWTVSEQQVAHTKDGFLVESLVVTTSSGDRVDVEFEEAAADDSLEGEGKDRTGDIEALLMLAGTYAEQNPPHHPGALPRFPVPSRSYADALDIPLPIRAMDDNGVAGLYAPARFVSLRRDNHELIGVGEYPGFDPEEWPPARIGEWPPVALESLSGEEIQAKVACFSACWSRILEAWFANTVVRPVVLKADITAALTLRAELDGSGMQPKYDELNPVFAKWITTNGQ